MSKFKTAELREDFSSNNNYIFISLGEYKELLITKGKYEELKNSHSCNGICKNNGKHSCNN